MWPQSPWQQDEPLTPDDDVISRSSPRSLNVRLSQMQDRCFQGYSFWGETEALTNMVSKKQEAETGGRWGEEWGGVSYCRIHTQHTTHMYTHMHTRKCTITHLHTRTHTHSHTYIHTYNKEMYAHTFRPLLERMRLYVRCVLKKFRGLSILTSLPCS